MKNKNLSDLKQEFKEKVDTSHIEYDWDCGHCYSFINHPIMEEGDKYREIWGDKDYNEWDTFTHEWLYDNDDCPPCEINIDHENEFVDSSCGCHDHLDYHKDRQEWEGVVDILTEEFDKRKYPV